MELVSRKRNAGYSGWTTSEEEADLEINMRLARRWKRRGIDRENLGLNSRSKISPNKTMHRSNKKNDAIVKAERVCPYCKKFLNDMKGFVDFDVGVDTNINTGCSDDVDSDYEKFLNDIKQFETRWENYADAAADNNVRDVLNPHCMMLLDNLKEHRKSYALEPALGVRTSVAVKYKKKDGSNDAFELESLETRKCCWKQDKLRTENVLKCHSGKEKIDSPRTSRSNALGIGTSVAVMYGKKDGSNDGFSLENLETRKCYWKQEELRAKNVLKCHSAKENIDSPRTLKSSLGREKTENQERAWRGLIMRENCENSSWVSKSNIGREKLESPINVLRSNSKRRETEIPKKTLSKSKRKDIEIPIMHDVENPINVLRRNSKRRETEIPRRTFSKSKRKDNETPIMHDVVKREKTERLRTLRITRGDENSSNLHDVEKIEKAESVKTWRNVLRRESVENESRKIEISRKTCDKSKKNDNESPIMHAEVNREKTENLITLRSNLTRETNESSSDLHDVVKREKAESARNLRNVLRRESMGNSWRRKTEIPTKTLSKSKRKDDETPCIMHDVVKREKNESQRTFRSNSRRGNNESLNVLCDVVKRQKAENAGTLRNLLRRESMGTRKKLRKQVVEKIVEKEAEDPIPSTEDCCSTKGTTNSAKYKIKSVSVDESYREFLKLMKGGYHLVYQPEVGKVVAYDESDSDSEVVVMDDDPFADGNFTPFVDEDGERCVETFTRFNASEFREKLMECLQRPYDRMECKKLLLEASYKRSLELYCNGKSYLDEYSDLAVLIDEAQRDKRRILNLLRGFFFWLQNLVHEGQFKPWLDSSCLSILPPN